MLSHPIYIERISDYISRLKKYFKNIASNGLTDGLKYAEPFVQGLLNLVYDLELESLNASKKNFPGVDLGDKKRKIAYQVTATNTKRKIEQTFEKCERNGIFQFYEKIKFFIITEKLPEYSLSSTYVNKYGFNYKEDIIDFDDILNKIISFEIGALKYIHSYVENNFASTQDDLIFLEQHLDEYVLRTLSSEHSKKISSVYVDIYSKSTSEYDCIGIEVSEEEDFKYNNSFFSYENSSTDQQDITEENNGNDLEVARIDTILNIANDTNKFLLLGDGGAGKSTTLQKIHYLGAQKNLSESNNTHIPIYLIANKYGKNGQENFINMIAREMRLTTEQIKTLLIKGRLQLLIDGLNEIDKVLQDSAEEDLCLLLKHFSNTSIIISSRKYKNKYKFGIPVFQLKELQEADIKKYFTSNTKVSNVEILYESISNNQDLMMLISNPLMLYMFSTSITNEGKVPENKGNLYNAFTNYILKKEYKKTILKSENYANDQSFIDEVILFLSELSFEMTLINKVSISIDTAKRIAKKNHNYNIYQEILNSKLLLLEDDNGNTLFYHETYLEYFCSCYLAREFREKGNVENVYWTTLGVEEPTNAKWNKAIVMCGDMMNDKKDFAEYIDFVFRGELHRNVNEVYPKSFAPYPKSLKLSATFQTLRENKRVFLSERIPFTDAELNKNIIPACRIAYNSRNRFPDIYTVIEKYMGNYMTIYPCILPEMRVNFPTSYVIGALAALSSHKLMSRLFSSIPWNLLFFKHEINDEQDGNNIILLNDIDIETAFITNLSDFMVAFNLLLHLNVHAVFQEIKEPLKLLKQSLMLSAKVSDLKRIYYNSNNNQELLKFIGRIDIDFFMENYDHKNIKPKYIVNVLLSNVREEKNRKKLIELLFSSNEIFSSFAKDIIYRLSLAGYHKELFGYFESKYRTEQFKDYVLFVLQRIDFSELTFGLQRKLSTIDEILSFKNIKFESIEIYNKKVTVAFLIIKSSRLAFLNELKNVKLLKIEREIFPVLNTNIEVYTFANERIKHIDMIQKTENEDFLYHVYYSLDSKVCLPATVTKIGLKFSEEGFESKYHDISSLHPDIIKQNNKYMDLLRIGLMHRDVHALDAVKKSNLIHAFHRIIPNVEYSIVIVKKN